MLASVQIIEKAMIPYENQMIIIRIDTSERGDGPEEFMELLKDSLIQTVQQCLPGPQDHYTMDQELSESLFYVLEFLKKIGVDRSKIK